MNRHISYLRRLAAITLAATLTTPATVLAHNGTDHTTPTMSGFDRQKLLPSVGANDQPKAPVLKGNSAYEKYLHNEFYDGRTPAQKAQQQAEIERQNRNINRKLAQAIPNAAQVGAWSQVYDWPVYAIHLALMRDGKVMAWEGNGELDSPTLWDPATNTFTALNRPGKGHQFIFCSPHTLLPNGNLFVPTGYVGVSDPKVSVFDYGTKAWSALGNLTYGRYYPTATVLPNGNIFVSGGGFVEPDGSSLEVPELYENGLWRTLPGAKLDFTRNYQEFAYYYSSFFPWVQVAPNGRLFYAGSDSTLRYITPTGNGTLQTVGERDATARDYGSYATYTTGKFLIAGGGNSVNTAYTIDINGATPQVQQAASMAYGRRQQNLTILANGEVMVTGGHSAGGIETFSAAAAVYAGEIWNPTTRAWRTVASMSRPRQYHSTALLLPDGRLLSAGGICANCSLEKNAEIYSPPYLFNANGTLATRPVISAAPTTVNYGQRFNITSAQASTITKVHLIKLGSVTHATNFDQRLVPLTGSRFGTTLTLTAPANGNIAPPGHYMLIIVNSAGVPSVAKILRVGTVDTVVKPYKTILNPVANTPYRIVNRLTGKVLNVANASQDDGAPIDQFRWGKTSNQAWVFKPTSNGYYNIVAQHSGKVIDVPGNNDNFNDGPVIQQSTLQPTALDQQWQLTPSGDGYFRLTNRNSNKVIEIPGLANYWDGLPVQQWFAAPNVYDQQWYLEPAF